MKRTILTLFLLSTSFLSMAQSPNKKETTYFNGQIEQKIHYIEFVDKDNTPLSQEVIQQVKKELYDNGYILSNENSDWQGIRQVQMNEIIELHQVNEFHPNIHKFKDFSDYSSNAEDIKNDVEKIVITFNNSDADILSFNHTSFKKRGHEEWQNYSNAGNFKYNNKTIPSDKELNQWLVKIIVGLTFK